MVPSARYMHTVDFIQSLSLLAIFGGRNDTASSSLFAPVFSDLWILKLHNFEYVNVKVGGSIRPSGRTNHVSMVSGTQLIVFGGQNSNFEIRKDAECLELN